MENVFVLGGKRAAEACQRVWRYQPAVVCDIQSQRTSQRCVGCGSGEFFMMLAGGLYRSYMEKQTAWHRRGAHIHKRLCQAGGLKYTQPQQMRKRRRLKMNVMNRSAEPVFWIFVFCFTPPLSFTQRFWGDDYKLIPKFCQRAKEMFEKQELKQMSMGVDEMRSWSFLAWFILSCN